MRENGDLSKCAEEIADMYNISSPVGKIVYESFSDDELKDILIEVNSKLGRRPSQKDVFCIYRIYIRARFGNWPWALQAAGLKPIKEYSSKKRKKPYWRTGNGKNGGKRNAKHN